jgi:hypothetical protein
MGSCEYLIPYRIRNYATFRKTRDMLRGYIICPAIRPGRFQVPVPSQAWKFKSSSGQEQSPKKPGFRLFGAFFIVYHPETGGV